MKSKLGRATLKAFRLRPEVITALKQLRPGEQTKYIEELILSQATPEGAIHAMARLLIKLEIPMEGVNHISQYLSKEEADILITKYNHLS